MSITISLYSMHKYILCSHYVIKHGWAVKAEYVKATCRPNAYFHAYTVFSLGLCEHSGKQAIDGGVE